MSINRTTTVHCDSCGQWVHMSDLGQRQRRQWDRYHDNSGKMRHRCPYCVSVGAERQP